MPPPPRAYNTSKKPDLEAAVIAVRAGMSIRQASAEFDVRRSTLHDKVKNTHDRDPGRPCRLSADMEKILSEMVDVVAQWGYPLRGLEIKYMVKYYLDTLGEVSPVFIDNKPGDRWLRGFVKRCAMSARVATNIKRARAAITEESLNGFFDEFEGGGAADVPPDRMFNFDETNFTDDPGTEKCFVRRGTRRVEMVREHSKTAISVMWCGSASGVLQPPMVVFKAMNLYDGWTTGGPRGTVYDCTPSGWFDGRTFTKWFLDAFLPAVAHLEGKKVLLGDNLASHLTGGDSCCSAEQCILLCAATERHAPHAAVGAVPLTVKWPLRDIVFKTMPMSFRRKFKTCTAIIDCLKKKKFTTVRTMKLTIPSST